jgi:hypothetical protein
VKQALVVVVYHAAGGAVIAFCLAPQLVGLVCALVVATLLIDAATYLV